MDQTVKGAKRWCSKGGRKSNRKLRGSKFAGKQKSSGDRRAWWFVVLSRGVVRLKVMAEDWEQTGLGMAEFVGGLPALLNDMLGADAKKPRVCFTDRGPGLYNSLNGEIVGSYHEALQRYGFRSFAGVDGRWQPADLADFFLHEIVVAWVRRYFAKHPAKAHHSVDVNYNRFLERLKACEARTNANYEVTGLCRDAVKRLEELVAEKGARIWH